MDGSSDTHVTTIEQFLGLALGEPVEHAGREINALRGNVKRASFLGDSVDYEVAVADSDVVLRVLTPAWQRRKVGDVAGLEIAPAACVPLTDGDESPRA
jgi:hypothetical protein